MSKKPVNAPGGPAKVFGAENLAYTGPKAANSGSAVDGDAKTPLTRSTRTHPIT